MRRREFISLLGGASAVAVRSALHSTSYSYAALIAGPYAFASLMVCHTANGVAGSSMLRTLNV